ncbi:MAG TPA: SusD/RagB family nutrient-binding outer membrane lipoprotein [Longimicrobiaceae bacterium]|nr:SusD/RagB family nutrient-binding outer membrane lipoprotein [Longimicrobiaceae bacterium]
MKISRLSRVASVLAFAAVVGACDEGWTDLTGLNENPNSPTDVPAPFLFTEGTQEAASDLLGNSFNLDYGEHLVQHISEISYPEEDIYVYRGNEVNGLWREAYAEYLMDFQRVIEKGRETDQPNITAAGLVMKSWVFQNLTDIWGAMPYSQAFQGDSIVTPVYDSQQAIYTALFENLTTAAQTIDPATDPLGSQDLIYQGDMAKWQKFANSLRLRLAMRLSEVDPATAEAQFNAALAAPGGVFTSMDDNAKVCYGAVTFQPWYDYYQGRKNDYRVSATVIDTLKSLDDPRLGFFVQPIQSDSVEGEPVEGPVYRGMPSGLLDGHGYEPTETSYPGEYYLSQTGCLPIMTYAEVLFLRAEAAARGWTSGNAEQLYYDAITASMERANALAVDPDFEITDAEIAAYLAQPEVAWTGNFREQIGVQKWIALFGQGMEAFAEVRRLGYPVLTPGPGARIDELPSRFPYPYSEETFNEVNLKDALAAQGMANINVQTAPVWWDVE